MIRIKIIKDTIIKKQPIQSNLLSANQRKSLKANTTIKTTKIKDAINNHIEIDNGLYLYKNHIEVEQPNSTVSTKGIPIKYKSDTKLILDVPYLSQLDNKIAPQITCNMTSVAMILLAYKKASKFVSTRVSTQIQLEDILTQYCSDNGLNRESPMDMRYLIRNKYGLEDNFVTNATIKQIKHHLDTHNPVIVHGYFTGSGHIIVINGYDEMKQCFIVCDPYGEYYAGGYDTYVSGENLEYSYELIKKLCSPEGENYIWCHFITQRDINTKK